MNIYSGAASRPFYMSVKEGQLFSYRNCSTPTCAGEVWKGGYTTPQIDLGISSRYLQYKFDLKTDVGNESFPGITGYTAKQLEVYNVTWEYEPPLRSNIDLLFASEKNPLNWKVTFNDSEDFYTYINWTFANATAINSSYGICNITLKNSYISYDSVDQDFTLCGSGCDYSHYYDNITGIETDQSINDVIHFYACHNQLIQGDMILNISCNAGSEQWPIPAGNVPLCEDGTAFVSRNTSKCINSPSVNITIIYDGINNRRKTITGLDIDRQFAWDINSYPTEVLYNSTLGLWRTTGSHEYYVPGSKIIMGNCSYTGDDTYSNSITELMSTINTLPTVTFGNVYTANGGFKLTQNMDIEYIAGSWLWTGSVSDIDNNLDNYTVWWLNSSGSILQNYLNLQNQTNLTTLDGLFSKMENPYTLQVLAYDKIGGLVNYTIANLTFNVVPFIPESNVSNLALSSGTCITSTNFILNGTFDCTGEKNCTGTWNITNSGTCIPTGDTSGIFNVLNQSSSSVSATYACAISGERTFNFTILEDDLDFHFTSYNVSCSGGGGLTPDESSCILTGKYVNGSYCGSAAEVKKVGSSLAIVVFMLSIVTAFLVLPSKIGVKINNPVGSFVLKRGSLVIGIFLLTMTTAMVATIAEWSGIGLTKELFTTLWIVGRLGYILTVYLVIGTLIRALKMWKLNKIKNRTGYEKE